MMGIGRGGFALLGLALAGCSTMQAYEGERRSRNDLAHIVGDWRLRAGAPLSVILRRVDEIEVGLRYSAAGVLPGQHQLLVDCTVAATGHISRYELDVEVDAGARYRLVADTAAGNRECGAVQLERLD